MKNSSHCHSSSSSSSPFPSPTSVIPSPPRGLGMNRDSRAISKPAAPSNNIVTTTKPPKIRIIHIFAPEIIKTDVTNFRELVQRLTGKPTPHPDGQLPPKKKRGNKKTNNNNKNLPPTPPHLPPLMIQDDVVGSCRNDDDQEEARAAVTTTSTQYSSGFSDENYGNNDENQIDNLFGNGGGGFGFEFLAAAGKESSGCSGRMVKEEEENEMLWINSNGKSNGGEVGAGCGGYFGELDDGGFIEELGDHEFPLLLQEQPNRNYHHHHHQQINYSLNLHGFGSSSEATQFA